MYGLLALLGYAFGLLPRTFVSALGRAFGLFVGFVLRIRLAQVKNALRDTQVTTTAWEVYGRLGSRLFLLLRAWSKPLDPCVEISARTEGEFPKGPFVLAAMHAGAWELAAFALARTGRTVTCMVHPPSVAPVRAFLTKLRARGGVSEILPDGALSRAGKELAQGHVVVCVADQVPRSTKHAVRGVFLGRPAWLDKTAALIAARAKVPLVVCGVSGVPGHETVEVLEVLSPYGATALATSTQRVHRAIDAFVRSHPEDWLWLHRRWRDPLPETSGAPRLRRPLPLELSTRQG